MVTAKVKVGRITPFQKAEDGSILSAEVEMTPDYAQGKNKEWATATPSAVFRMTIQNPAALAQFTEAHNEQKGITVTFVVED